MQALIYPQPVLVDDGSGLVRSAPIWCPHGYPACGILLAVCHNDESAPLSVGLEYSEDGRTYVAPPWLTTASTENSLAEPWYLRTIMISALGIKSIRAYLSDQGDAGTIQVLLAYYFGPWPQYLAP